jgi:homoserine O-acetyltransferase
MRALKDKLATMGKTVTYSEAITTDLGHLDGIAYIAKAGDEIASFLEERPLR